MLERAADIGALVNLLRTEGVRLVTVTGPSGVGKTTVAEEALRCVLDIDPVTARAVDLHGLAPHAAAAAIRAGATIAGPASETGPAPAGRSRLLLIDGTEVVEGIADIIAEMLDANADLTILATGVVPLNLRGEHLFRLTPLTTDPDDTGTSPAARFLLARLVAHGGRYEDGAATRRVCDELCAATGGLPLALDLVAARAARTSLQTVLEDLHGRSTLSVLEVDRADAAPRHRSLRSTIAWTCERLDAADLDLLGRLAALPGDATLDSVAELCGLGDPPATVEVRLARLHDSGLVRLHDRGGTGRDWWVSLDPPVRDFANDVLLEGAVRDEVVRRHAAHFRALARRAAQTAWSVEALEMRPQLANHAHDLIAAVGWYHAVGDRAAATEMVADLHGFWLDTDATELAHGLLTDVLDTDDDLPATLRARALVVSADLRVWARRISESVDAHLDALRQAAACATEASDHGLSLAIAEQIAHTLLLFGRPDEALEVATATREEARRIGHEWWYTRLTTCCATAANQAGREDLALEYGVRAFQEAHRLGDDSLVVWAGIVLTGIPGAPERLDDATPELDDLIGLAHNVGDPLAEALLRTASAVRHARLGAIGPAIDGLRAALDIARAHDFYHLEELCVLCVVLLAIAVGRFEEGVRLHGALEPLLDDLRRVQSPAQQRLYDGTIDVARNALGPAAFAEQLRRGGILGWRRVLTAAEDLLDDLYATLVDEPDPTPAASASNPTSSESGDVPRLTPRELDVLRLIAEGRSNKEIAVELALRPKTVMHHTTSIYRKLGVQSRTEAAAVAWRRGTLS